MEIYKILKAKIDEIIINNDTDFIDYIGINIDMNLQIKYKIYYLNETYLNDRQNISNTASKLIQTLQEKKLIGLLCPVDDNDNANIERYEMKLSGRTNEQVNLFLEEISKYSNLVKENILEVLDIGRMRTIQEEGYDFASLYFFGMTLESQAITSVKFHYMTRLYERVGINDELEKFDNDYYIKYLTKLGIPQLENLIESIQNITDNKFGDIYLFGVDYFINGNKKYKLYIKNRICSLDYLSQVLAVSGISNIKNVIKELEEVKKFFDIYPSIFFDGHALCNDTNGLSSVNLYFKFNKKLGVNICTK